MTVDLPPIAFNVLIDAFTENELIRAQNYVAKKKVKELHVQCDDLGVLRFSAKVQGTQRNPYSQRIIITNQELLGDCSCPVGFNCKHVAAVLMRYFERNGNAQLAEPEFEKRVDAELVEWVEGLQELQQQERSNKALNQTLVFLLDIYKGYQGYCLSIKPALCKPLKRGGLGKPKVFTSFTESVKREVSESDYELLSLLLIYSDNALYAHKSEGFLLYVDKTEKIINKLIAHGHCYWQSMSASAIQKGPKVQGQFTWEENELGEQRLTCQFESVFYQALPSIPLLYLNTATMELGPFVTKYKDEVAASLLLAPAVEAKQANAFAQLLAKQHDIALPKPKTYKKIKTKYQDPVGILHVDCVPIGCQIRKRGQREKIQIKDVIIGKVSYQYGPFATPFSNYRDKITCIEQDAVIEVKRDFRKEAKMCEVLEHFNLETVDEKGILPSYYSHNDHDDDIFISYANDSTQAQQFVNKIIPEMEKKGWKIFFEKDIPSMQQFVEVEQWYAELNESSEYDWFDFELGVIVDGEKMSLLPHLVEAINKGKLNDDGKCIILTVAQSKAVSLPRSRMQKVIEIISQYIDPARMGDGESAVKLSGYQASLLNEIDQALQASKLRWFGDMALLDLGRRLNGFKQVESVKIPASFSAKLRPYQQVGVNWLQFLVKYNLNGILADDMGLGKTVQTLAHIAIEKEAGRMNKPCLIVAPTSVINNWVSEAEKFVSSLKVLLLHGSQRSKFYNDVNNYDIVVTTYPLLVRDKTELMKSEYHLLILDEAQFIKNAQAKMTQVVSQLKAKHRLCLTGTPLENHLGELWSLFNFLTPGLLGDAKSFRQQFRVPIEKDHSAEKQHHLSKRVGPFILRRKKDDVLTDLPKKTEIIQHIDLDIEQRDLYEGLRLSMNKKIKQAIDQKGIERSQIMILDALLKLRQVCCDPALLKLDAAKKITQSAKLDFLMNMLQELLGEQRKILVFSQFTSMLALIEKKLKQQKISYVKLTGQTKDRKTPVEKFQSGKISVFLISLKAGGTGLNLTAADTVIHYDPWWNPAVEMQATDRAHRIGQENPVFVYKLVATETIEEKMLEMQEKKKAMMDAVFSSDHHKGSISTKDLEYLFT